MTSSQMDNEKNENERVKQVTSDFSIEHILNRAGNCTRDFVKYCEGPNSHVPFPWLQYTRYCPPKIQRNQRRDGQKRQLGTHPRIPFTSHQLSILEERFQSSPYLSSEEVTHLSRSLHLPDIRVKIWFQNRRARERRERNNKIVEREVENNTTCVPPIITNVNLNGGATTSHLLPSSNLVIRPMLTAPTQKQFNIIIASSRNCDDNDVNN